MLSAVRTLARLFTTFAIVAAVVAIALLGPSLPAQAEEELLRGPHPFIKDSEVTLHAGYSAGFGDNVRGLRVQGDYLYRLQQSVWLDLQMAVIAGSCHSDPAICSSGSGAAVDIAAGAVWKFQTNLPIVPYVKAAAGPLFLFPQDSRSAAGVLLRGGLGAHYYLFDWFGVGAEVSGAGGVAFYGVAGHNTSGVGDVAATVGVALQF